MLKNWYRELFWMGVGAVTYAGVSTLVKLVVKKVRERKNTETDIPDEMRHTVQFRPGQTMEDSAVLEVEESDPPVPTQEEKKPDPPVFEEVPPVIDWKTETVTYEQFQDTKNGPPSYQRMEVYYSTYSDMYFLEEVEDSVDEDDLAVRDILGPEVCDAVEDASEMVEEGFAIGLVVDGGDRWVCVHFTSNSPDVSPLILR